MLKAGQRRLSRLKGNKMKTLVLYYSLEGNTKNIAERIAAQCKGDLVELVPEKPNPSEGFGKYFWGGKSVFFKETPKLINEMPDLSLYDLIFIGSPLWAGSFSPAINTLLNTVSFKNKKVALFVCHSGGSTQSTYNRFKALLSDATIVGFEGFKDPLIQDQESMDKEIALWIEEII